MSKLKGRVRGEHGKKPRFSFRELQANKKKTPKKQPVILVNNNKKGVTKAGISFVDEASVERYKKQRYSFTNSWKITTVNKI